jgi:hypothetical protein
VPLTRGRQYRGGRQLTEELGRGVDGSVDKGCEILEIHPIQDSQAAARNNSDALRIGGSVHDRGNFPVLLIPRIGQARQPIAVGGGKEARGVHPKREHIAAPAGDSEVDVQPPGVGVRDKEVLAIVLAAEIPPSAGAQVVFDEVSRPLLTQRLTHGVNAEVSALGDPLSRAVPDRRIR